MSKKLNDRNWRYIGDVNMLDYGGHFYRRVGGRRWHFIDLTNMDEACGRDNKGQDRYVIELSEVDLDLMTPDRLADACRCVGFDHTLAVGDLEELTDEMLADACFSYGAKAVLDSYEGNNAHRGLRECRSESRALTVDTGRHETAMSRTVNRIGSSAVECMTGDLNSAILRGLADGRPEADLMARMGMLGRPLAVGEVLTVTLLAVPSPDPVAYVAGFQEGRAIRPLPPIDSKARRELAPAYVEGHREGMLTMLNRHELPSWAQP